MVFLSVLRQPDSVYGATNDTPLRFEEKPQDVCPVKYDYIVSNGVGKLTVYPSGSPVKYLKLRFRGELNFVDKVYGDQWERSGLQAFVEWRSVMAHRVLPWYTYLIGDNTMACYGIKVQPNAMCYWQVDTHGVTLFVNLCCGNEGTDLKEPIVACEVVELFGNKDEDPYKVAQKFSKTMCDKPVLPKQPIFGVLDWYWAYGDTSEEIILEETDYVMKMCDGTKHKPYVIIDEGWQKFRSCNPPNYCKPTYIGGPWDAGNEKFPNFDKMPEKIHQKGALAGVWYRVLQTMGYIPEDAVLYKKDGAVIMDPSHPYTLKRVYDDAKRFSDWGFDLLKQDFTTCDAMGIHNFSSEKQSISMVKPSVKFYDKTKTTAMIFKNLYNVIQDGFGRDKEVMACNTFTHLTAGIHSINRVGNDNSGMAYEWTRRDGINSFLRLPTNNIFYCNDPDVATFTDKTPIKVNLDFLEACALTGMATFSSATPGILSEEELKRINRIYKIADQGGKGYGIVNFDKNANPEEFISPDGKEYIRFNFDEPYDGTRNVVDWYE